MSAGTKTNGRTYRTRGVNERSIRLAERQKHSDLDPQGLLTETVMQSYISAGLCPYCKRGPFQNLAGHTVRAHGMDRRELRNAAGLSLSQPVASAELRAKRAAISKRVGFGANLDPVEAGKRAAVTPKRLTDASRRRISESTTATFSSMSAEQKAELFARRTREADKQRVEEGHRKQAETLRARGELARSALLSEWKKTAQDLEALAEFAADRGKAVPIMRKHIQRAGGTVPDGRSRVITHCKKRGHEFTAENTIVNKDGTRQCRACVRINESRRVRKGGER